MSTLADKLLAIHDALAAASLPHAFGGAIALAYCTEEPRGTRDIDVNVFAKTKHAADVLAALPPRVAVSAADIKAAERDGQVRMWWDDTPIDLFLNVEPLHDEVVASVREVPFAQRSIPVLGCTALVVFKALFNRTRDWADIEAIVDARASDPTQASAWLARIVDADDPIVARLNTLRA